jgi:hypothetical protein
LRPAVICGLFDSTWRAILEITLDDKLRVVARQAVLEEITFRMTKLWWIFSWTSTVLVAMTGGVIGLRTVKLSLGLEYQGVIAALAVILGVYAVTWLRQNLRLEGLARDALAAHDEALGINAYNALIGGSLPRPDKGIVVGYQITVALLTIVTVAVSLVPLK